MVGNSTNRFSVSKFIVAPTIAEGATHTTIASALADSSEGDSIFVKPGTYTESPALIDGINLVALTERGATKPEIIGQCSITTGTANIKGLQLTENGSAAVACSSTGGVNIYNCDLTCSTADLITNSGSGLIRVEYSSVNLTGNFKAFACSGSGGIFFRYCTGSNTASTTASTHSGTGATVRVEHCDFPISFSTSGSCSTIIGTSSLYGEARNNTILTTAGTGSHSIHNCNISSGTSSCLSVGSGTTLTTANTNYESSNTNAITGAGIVKAGDLTFSGTSSLINTTTQTELEEVHGPISFDGGTNFLDEYEEGTWTPTIIGSSTAGTASYTQQFGWYQRIGNTVYYAYRLNYTSGNGTGNLRVQGLPFTSSATIYNNVGSCFADGQLLIATGVDQVSIGQLANSTQISYDAWNFNTALSAVAYDAACITSGSGSYRI